MSGAHFMLLSALSFAVMGVMVKLAGATGLPVMQIIAVRAVISVALSLVAIQRAGVHPLGNRRWLLLARGIVGFLSLSCVFYAILHLPYAQATILQYLHPVFTAVLAYWLLREVPERATVVCVLLSLMGLAVMLAPALGSAPAKTPWLAIIAGMGGAFGSGLAYTLVRKLAPFEHPAVIVLYFPMVCIPATLLMGATDFVWPTATGWAAMLGVGIFAQLGQLALTYAMGRDSASRAASLSYLQIVFAALLGALLFGEIPSAETTLGALFILLGAFAALKWRRPRSDAR